MGTPLPRIVCLSVLFSFFAAMSTAQQVSPQPLITQPVMESQVTTLKGNTHPLAQPQFDIGAAPPDLPMQRMLLVLKRSPQQDFALRKLLDDQQDKASPNYHKWLTPDEFGLQFGPSDQDIQVVTGWLQSHGFQVNRVSHGRTVIEFSGAEAQVEEALHTSIHKYLVNGQEHWANASDPQIPAALAPAVAGVWTLHDFRKKPHVRFDSTPIAFQHGAQGQVTFPNPPGPNIHALGPQDYAKIYNINPVYQAGIDGTGVTIAVVGRTNFSIYDVWAFRSLFGLNTNNVNIFIDGPDPGIISPGEQFEATLDATWSGAIAPGAAINFVASGSTITTDGVDLSELYIIDNNFGNIMTESFGTCEAGAGAQAQGLARLAEQAAAQGITYFVSSGDTGAEGCDNLSETRATGPLSVNILASTPFTVAVGGTMFNENGQNSKYWGSLSPLSETALSYIPENVWNESCTACQSPNIAAGGGGASSIFSKPSWQVTTLTGVPNDGKRDVPDVSLTAALHDPYLLCVFNSCGSNFIYFVGGTSASAPSFAGIMALVDQQMSQANAASARQGQADYVFYSLAAAESFSQCNASNTSILPASTCVFNDVTKGNNVVPGEVGTNYAAGTGYDLAAGLGSVNVSNLVNAWKSATFSATNTTLRLTSGNSVNVTHGTSVGFDVNVSANSGTPTGDVSLIGLVTPPGFGNPVPRSVTLFTLNQGTASTATTLLPGGTNYNVTAHYEGDGKFAPSDSAPITVTVTPEPSVSKLSVLTADASGNPIPFTSGPYGSFVYLRTDVTAQSGQGIPSGIISYSDTNPSQPAIGFQPLNSEGNAETLGGIFYFVAGSHSASASYGGDNSFKASTSAPIAFTIVPASTSTSVTASPSSAALGSNVTLQANIVASGFGFAPGGTVTFFSGASPIGTAQAFLNLNISSNGVGSSAVLNTTSLPAGQDIISAQYSGDANYLASTSNSVTVNVQPDFTIAAGGPSITIPSPGGTGSLALTISGQAGYNSTVNFTSTSCSRLPFGTRCSFSPASITGSGSTTVTVSTTAPTFAGLQRYGWTGFGFVVAGVFLLGIPSRRFRPTALLSVLLVVLVVAGTGCGGGSSSGGGGHTPGTPPGSYVITVTAASGVITHTTTFTLIVQ